MEESRSLHKLLYPENNYSIAFKIFHLPLSYIPAVLRVFTGGILGVGAYFNGNLNPLEPLRRASNDLMNKTAKDLTRLIVFTNYLLYLPYLLACTFVKMAANITILTVGRVAGLFGFRPAHFLHQMFSGVHVFLRNVTEYLFPKDVLKSVEIAHPNHTMREVESSYVTLMKKIGQEEAEDTPVPIELAVKEPSYLSFIMKKKSTKMLAITQDVSTLSPEIRSYQ